MPKVSQSTLRRLRDRQLDRHALDVEGEPRAERRRRGRAAKSSSTLTSATLGIGPQGALRRCGCPAGSSVEIGEALLAGERPAAGRRGRAALSIALPLRARSRRGPGEPATGVPSMAARRAIDDRHRVDPQSRRRRWRSGCDARPLVGLDVDQEGGRRVGGQLGGELAARGRDSTSDMPSTTRTPRPRATMALDRRRRPGRASAARPWRSRDSGERRVAGQPAHAPGDEQRAPAPATRPRHGQRRR